MFLIRPLDGTSERELQIDKLKLLRIEKKGKCVERRGNKTWEMMKLTGRGGSAHGTQGISV